MTRRIWPSHFLHLVGAGAEVAKSRRIKITPHAYTRRKKNLKE
jgi:hypothetical protein